MFIVLTVIVVIVVVAGIGFAAWAQVRRHRLRERFGPEYDRTVERNKNTREAERELVAREQRHAKLNIRPLTPEARERYRGEWGTVQERFVDVPAQAVTEADRLVLVVMDERGYPTEGYEQQVDDLSVEHGTTVERYRAAHEISGRAETDEASTEDLRQAMVHYRALFQELLADGESEAVGARDAGTPEEPGTESPVGEGPPVMEPPVVGASGLGTTGAEPPVGAAPTEAEAPGSSRRSARGRTPGGRVTETDQPTEEPGDD